LEGWVYSQVKKYLPVEQQRPFNLQEYMMMINRSRPDLSPVKVPEYHESPIVWGRAISYPSGVDNTIKM
jgi:hypothetical protein